MSNEEIDRRVRELLARIPRGTYCDESNNCGGYLTAEETDELEGLLAEQQQRRANEPNAR